MTKRKLQKIKRQILAERYRMDVEAVSKRKLPAWCRFASWLGFRGPADAWLERWQKKHDEKLKRATTQTLKKAIAYQAKVDAIKWAH